MRASLLVLPALLVAASSQAQWNVNPDYIPLSVKRSTNTVYFTGNGQWNEVLLPKFTLEANPNIAGFYQGILRGITIQLVGVKVDGSFTVGGVGASAELDGFNTELQVQSNLTSPYTSTLSGFSMNPSVGTIIPDGTTTTFNLDQYSTGLNYIFITSQPRGSQTYFSNVYNEWAISFAQPSPWVQDFFDSNDTGYIALQVRNIPSATVIGPSYSFNGDNVTGSAQLRVNYFYLAVPEPSTYGLMIGGLALAAVAIRRRRKASKA